MPDALWLAGTFAVGAIIAFIVARATSAKPALPAPAPAAALPSVAPAPVVKGPTPEQLHASGLFLLSMFQREGRLVDFLQEDVAGFTDEQIGAAARVVHDGCKKLMAQYLTLEPVLNDAEGAQVQVPLGFDAQRIRLTGNVAGAAPFKGSLKHHGWAIREIKLPVPPASMDPKVLAPAEVELP